MVSCSTTCAPPYSFLLLRRTAAIPCLIRRRNFSIFTIPNTILRSNTNPRLPGRPASLSNTHLSLSWFSPPQPPAVASADDDDDYNGWAVVEAPPPYRQPKKKGLPPFVIGVIGTLAVPVLAAVAYFSLSKKGFNLQFSTTWRTLSPVEIKADVDETRDWAADQNAVLSQSRLSEESMLDRSGETLSSAHQEKLHRVMISAPVDSTQMESLSNLKKLKIIEDCTRANELCTRREYARWLVCLNSLLERNPKHRIVPSVSLSGSTVAAFDDLSVEDEDFEFIQALAEAGIIPSKLSCPDNSKGDRSCCFYPDSYISRQDVIVWKAQLEYEILPMIMEQSRCQEQK
uniref:SLH domain-containing protein n=1 Tax=Rhizophora mucronata TaxID=61149 RepID=A0A2P2K8Z1_RHIMU